MRKVDFVTMDKAVKMAMVGVLAIASLGSCDKTTIVETVYDTVIVQDKATIALNRAALMKMNVGGTITVVGHKSQDADAVCSAISMAALLQELGMPVKAVIQEKPIQAVRYIFDYLEYPEPDIQTSIEPGSPLVLTDHNDPLQSLDGMMEANVVGIVDHHGICSGFTTNVPIYLKTMDTGSACTIVYTIYKECGLKPSKEIAQLMVAGIIADTDSLTKATHTAADSLALTALVDIAGIANLSEMTQGICMAKDSYIGMSDEEIFKCDMKIYEICGVKMAVASLDANEQMGIWELCERMRRVMPALQTELGVQMMFAKMEEKTIHPEILDDAGNPVATYITHIPYYGEGAEELVKEAFGRTVHDNCVVLDRKISRKTDFIPMVTNVLSGRKP